MSWRGRCESPGWRQVPGSDCRPRNSPNIGILAHGANARLYAALIVDRGQPGRHRVGMSRIAKAVVLVAVIQALAGCGPLPTQPNGGSGAATGAGPATGGGSAAGEQVKGHVYDSAFRPLAAAVVEVLDGPQAGTTALSDSRGEFALTATVDDQTRLRATKDGHVPASGKLMPYCLPQAVCTSHRWIHFYLQSLSPSINLAGNYTLTFVADSVCTGIPSAWRTRSYAATIAPASDSVSPAGTLFEATMPGVPYWTDRHSIPIRVSGDFVWFILGEHGSPYFVEEIGPGAYIHFDGGLRFSVGAATVSTISASLIGWADYWGPAVANPVHCVSENHQMTLTRR